MKYNHFFTRKGDLVWISTKLNNCGEEKYLYHLREHYLFN